MVRDFLEDEYLVMTMAGAPGHDDMLDCLANVENTELLRKVVWPIAPRRDPVGGGMYRRTEGTKDGGWILEYPQFFFPKKRLMLDFIG